MKVGARVKTWMLELAFVAGALGLVWGITRGTAVDLLGCVAVILTFAHAQVADRMAEKQAALTVPDVHCYRWAARYYIGKEVCWFAYFAALQSWPALVGVVAFLAYPIWRRHHRER